MAIEEFFAQIDLSDDERSIAINVVSNAIGENELNWDFNSYHMPQSAKIHDQPYLFYWSPIIVQGIIQEIIISIRDASSTLALEKEYQEKQKIIEVVRAGKKGYSVLKSLSGKLFLPEVGNKSSMEGALIQAHTLKGEVRIFNFVSLQDLIHHFEQNLLDNNFSKAKEFYDETINEADSYINIYQSTVISSENEDQESLLSTIQSTLQEAQKRLVEKGFELFTSIEVPFQMIGDQELDSLKQIVIHGITNCVDHGFLNHFEKFGENDRKVNIGFSLTNNNNEFQLEISDNGVGVNWEALKKIAAKKGIETTNKEKLAAVIFENNVSTVDASKVSKTSGRGIGMAAVAFAASNLGATIKFGDREEGRGSLLQLKWAQIS